MRRLLKASAVLTILAITFILLYGPIYRYVQCPVGWELKKRVRDARATEVDMARIAAFPWDELFLFDPYSSPQSICKTLALQPGECATTIKNELEDEGEAYESIEEIWPDYPTKDDFFFNEDEY